MGLPRNLLCAPIRFYQEGQTSFWRVSAETFLSQPPACKGSYFSKSPGNRRVKNAYFCKKRVLALRRTMYQRET